jgi:hypothetical protein
MQLVVGVLLALLEALAVTWVVRGIVALLSGRWRASLLAVGGAALFWALWGLLPAIAGLLGPGMFGSRLDTTGKDSVLQLNIVVLLDFVQLGVLFGLFNGIRAALRDGQRAASGPSNRALQQTGLLRWLRRRSRAHSCTPLDRARETKT